MKISLSTGSLYTYGLARVFELAAEAGFDGVEVLVDERWDTRQVCHLRQLADAYLPILSLHNPFAVQVPGWEGGRVAMLRQTVELAQALDVSVVVTHLPMRWRELRWQWTEPPRRGFLPIGQADRGYERWLTSDGLSDLERGSGVRIGVENMPQSKWWLFAVDRFRMNVPQAMRRYDHLTMDTTHLGTWGLDVLAYYERYKDRIVNIHLSNYDGQEHCLPWAGELPLSDFVRKLHDDRYAGCLTIELHPQALGAEDESVVKKRLAEIIVFCTI